MFERYWEQGRFGKNDGFKGRLLDLAAEKQGDRAVVVLIIGIMMDEFVQAWADDQDRSPLEHGSQKQRDHLRTDEGGGILSGARLFGFWFAVHERLQRLASREERGRRRILKGSLDYCNIIATILLQGEELYFTLAASSGPGKLHADGEVAVIWARFRTSGRTNRRARKLHPGQERYRDPRASLANRRLRARCRNRPSLEFRRPKR